MCISNLFSHWIKPATYCTSNLDRINLYIQISTRYINAFTPKIVTFSQPFKDKFKSEVVRVGLFRLCNQTICDRQNNSATQLIIILSNAGVPGNMYPPKYVPPGTYFLVNLFPQGNKFTSKYVPPFGNMFPPLIFKFHPFIVYFFHLAILFLRSFVFSILFKSDSHSNLPIITIFAGDLLFQTRTSGFNLVNTHTC